MNKDWTGGRASVFKTLGASNHCDHERQQHDYYATEPDAAKWLCKLENLSHNIWEPACGEGHLAKVFVDRGHNVLATDLIDRGYGHQRDFLAIQPSDVQQFHSVVLGGKRADYDIVTNPPYKYAREFVEKSLSLVPEGCKVCMFLKLTFLEGKGRRELFANNPPIRVWVSSSRLQCAMNGDFASINGSATAYAWFVWQKGYKGETTLKWFN